MCAVETRLREYDLYLKIDTNTKGHCQWFYFTVFTTNSGNFKLNVVNMVKSKSV